MHTPTLMLMTCCCVHAELVFKVTEDFSNVVEAIEVTFNITKEAILEFGRWVCPVTKEIPCTWTIAAVHMTRPGQLVRLSSILRAQQPHEHGHGVEIHRRQQHTPGGQLWQRRRHLLLAGAGGHCEPPHCNSLFNNLGCSAQSPGAAAFSARCDHGMPPECDAIVPM